MYIIKKSDHVITCACDSVWGNANVAEINNFNWDKNMNTPHTTAKLLWSEAGVHVRMVTDETPLLARVTKQNGDVYADSCMEFFIRPNANDERYINFEFNAFGTNYFSVRYSRDNFELTKWGKKDFNVKSKVNDGEWVLMFTMPFRMVDEIFGGHTDTMYGNLYKCCEDKEPMHFASFYPIDTPTPDFHCPLFFGEFILEK